MLRLPSVKWSIESGVPISQRTPNAHRPSTRRSRVRGPGFDSPVCTGTPGVWRHRRAGLRVGLGGEGGAGGAGMCQHLPARQVEGSVRLPSSGPTLPCRVRRDDDFQWLRVERTERQAVQPSSRFSCSELIPGAHTPVTGAHRRTLTEATVRTSDSGVHVSQGRSSKGLSAV